MKGFIELTLLETLKDRKISIRASSIIAVHEEKDPMHLAPRGVVHTEKWRFTVLEQAANIREMIELES